LNRLVGPKDILVSAINLTLDPNLKKELRDLAKHQLEDPRIHEIRRSLEVGTPVGTEKFMLRVGFCAVKMTGRTRTGGQYSVGI
jgi:hypothetical protein